MSLGTICDRRTELKFSWKVENFFSLSQEVDFYLNSPVFQFSGRRFFLQLIPNGERRFNSEGWIGLFLLIGESCPPLAVRYTLGIRTAKGDTEQWAYLNYTFERKCIGGGTSKCMKRSDFLLRRRELAPSDVLTLTVTLNAEVPEPNRDTAEVAVQASVEDAVGQEEHRGLQILEQRGLSTLGRSLKELYVAGKKSDVTLKVGDKKFCAHRLILEARTPVLAAMFSHNMAQSETGVVYVEDCLPEAFEVFLMFLYSGVAENLTNENATKVYYIADKYDLPDLRQECVRHMVSSLATDSVCNILALAARHGEEHLLEKATAYFLQNDQEIFLTDGWKKFLVDNTTQANDLLIRIVQSFANEK